MEITLDAYETARHESPIYYWLLIPDFSTLSTAGDFPGRPSALRSLHMVYSSPDSVSRGKTDTKSAARARGLARTSDSALSAENRQANL